LLDGVPDAGVQEREQGDDRDEREDPEPQIAATPTCAATNSDASSDRARPVASNSSGAATMSPSQA
jgi:hypothetical protein